MLDLVRDENMPRILPVKSDMHNSPLMRTGNRRNTQLLHQLEVTRRNIDTINNGGHTLPAVLLHIRNSALIDGC